MTHDTEQHDTDASAASPAAHGGLDRDAYARLLDETYPVLRVVAASEVGRSDAEDVVQQATIVALERLDRFTPGTDFRAWMSAIVRGCARNYRRSEKRRDQRERVVGSQRRQETSGETRSEASVAVRPGDGAPEFEIPSSFSKELRNAIEGLGPRERACFLLKAAKELSYREIASIMDLPEATARSHVHRARRRLLDALGGERGGAR